jgi:hypothetical protein
MLRFKAHLPDIHKKTVLLAVIRNNRGSAMMLVLITGLFFWLSILVWIYSTANPRNYSVSTLSKTQALLNARSGIYMAMDALTKKSSTLSITPEVVASFVGAGLFSDKNASGSTAKLGADVDRTYSIQFTEIDSSSITASSDDLFIVVSSMSRKNKTDGSVSARIGGRPFISSLDTVLYLRNCSESVLQPYTSGKVYCSSLPGAKIDDTLVGEDFFNKMNVNRMEIEKTAAKWNAFFDSTEILTRPAQKTEAFTQTQLADVPDTVTGDLIVKGLSGKLSWDAVRTVFVGGDLQVSGKVTMKGLKFVVCGNVKLFGDLQLSDMALVSRGIVYVGDEITSTKVSFEGTIIALGPVEVCRNSRIMSGSILLKLPLKSDNLVTQPDGQSEVTVYLRGSTDIDAVVINCAENEAIRTYEGARIRGILWSAGGLQHEGILKGVAVADHLVAGDPGAPRGRVEVLPQIGGVVTPHYIGRRGIVAWKEN